MSSERRQKTLQILELTPCSHVGLFVDSHPKFTFQTQSISRSHTRTDKEELHIKGIKWVLARGGKKIKIFELTHCSHVGLFVDSHPKLTCQAQSISGSHTSWRWGMPKHAGRVEANTQRAGCLTAHLSAPFVPLPMTICQQTQEVSGVYLMLSYMQQEHRGMTGVRNHCLITTLLAQLQQFNICATRRGASILRVHSHVHHARTSPRVTHW